MNRAEIDAILVATLDDGRLSRGERTALGDVFDDLDHDTVALVRSRVFAIARGELEHRTATQVLDWSEAVLHLLGSHAMARARSERDVRQEAWFSPDDACPNRIVEAIGSARTSIDVCIFTLTDDRIAEALLAAHARHIALRIVTDDDKADDLGSDVHTLQQAGIPLRMDRTPAHMHHKFALFDERLVLTGSYNWTRSADRDNRENFVVSDDPVLVRRFRAEFDRLWAEFDG